MISYLIQLAVKALFTGGLVLLIALCGIEIWRLWFDRTLVLVPFGYLRDGESVRESGQHFVQLVSQDLQLLRELYSPRPAGELSIPSTDQIGRGKSLELPVLQQSVFSEIEVQAYGIKFSELLRALPRWIERPNEITGNVSERAKRVDVFAELRTSRPSVTHEPGSWHIRQASDVNEASSALACRIFRRLAVKQSILYSVIDDSDFYVFTRALEDYQLYLTHLHDVVAEEKADTALAEASRLIGQLLTRESNFPFTYKLAAYIFREEGDLEEAQAAVSKYLEILNRHKQTDSTAAELAAELRGEHPTVTANVVASPERLNVRTRVRPIQPGTSVSSEKSMGGTICCIVQGKNGERYLLSADHTFLGTPGTAIFQPGRMDGGEAADRVAELTRTIPLRNDKRNLAAGAIAQLLPNVAVSQILPGVGPIKGWVDKENLQIGQRIRAIGRTSGLVEGRVTAFMIWNRIDNPEPLEFEGLIETTNISGPGDSGAPVFTDDGQLIGMVYAGSPKVTLVMPIGPVLRALEVDLVR
jgi:trypsin-like peptidase